jgi:hypothetical protein
MTHILPVRWRRMRLTSSRLSTTGTRCGVFARATGSSRPRSFWSTCLYRKRIALSAWFCVDALMRWLVASHDRNDVTSDAPMWSGCFFP